MYEKRGQVRVRPDVRERGQLLPEDVQKVDFRAVHGPGDDGRDVPPQAGLQPGLQRDVPHGAHLRLQGKCVLSRGRSSCPLVGMERVGLVGVTVAVTVAVVVYEAVVVVGAVVFLLSIVCYCWCVRNVLSVRVFCRWAAMIAYEVYLPLRTLPAVRYSSCTYPLPSLTSFPIFVIVTKLSPNSPVIFVLPCTAVCCSASRPVTTA